MIVTGSLIIPFSERFTLRTSAACASMLMFLWTTPMPPSLARAMAMGASVTVSIAADTIGMLRVMFREKRLLRSTSFGRTSEYDGMRSTSSKVRPSKAILSSTNDIWR